MSAADEAARIAQARRELGVALHRDVARADLAKLLGVDETTVWNWEKGEKRPSPASRALLSRVLGVTEAFLNYGTLPKQLAGWQPPDVSVLDAAKEEGRRARGRPAKTATVSPRTAAAAADRPQRGRKGKPLGTTPAKKRA